MILKPRIATADEPHDDVVYPQTAAFVLVHIVCFGAIFTGVSAKALWLAFALYFIRMFAATGAYHRYFAHRSFKTSRFGQFVLAVLAQSGAARGVIWWAATHRHHHLHSDQPDDVHSPRQGGFWHAHIGWIFTNRADKTDFSLVPDLMKFPELVFLNKYPNIPPALLGLGCFLYMGWEGLIVGFFWSTVALYHGTFCINSLAHVTGKQRYVTGDDSRNNWLLAIITLGEGWHNNHHHYQRSCRQGFRWYEIDITFYILRAASWVGLVWDLGAPPPDVVANERPLGQRVIEKVALHLAESWEHAHVPTMEELRERARVMYASTPSMDDIVRRAREMLDEAARATGMGHQLST